MMGSHLQSHVTHRPRGHVTNQKRYISTFTSPTDPKLCRVVAQMRRSHLQSHMTHQPRGHVTNQKTLYLYFCKAYGPQI